MTPRTPRPLLSMIVPMYNAAPFVRLAIGSILAQELDALGGATEIIIVDDGSTDESLAITRELAASHREIHVAEKRNGGVSSALNAGVRASRGDIVGFLHADDELLPGSLAFLLAEWERSEPLALSVVTAGLQTRAAADKIGAFDEELAAHDGAWMHREKIKMLRKLALDLHARRAPSKGESPA